MEQTDGKNRRSRKDDMTKEELLEITRSVNNHLTILKSNDLHVSPEWAKSLACAATIIELAGRVKEGDAKEDKSEVKYVGIVHLEQLHHALSSTIRLLHEFGCDSLLDITSYREDSGRVLFRVKGRYAIAPMWFRVDDVDLIHFARAMLGCQPLSKED